MPRIPKLKVPLQMGATGFLTVEQDSDDEVAQGVYAVLATPLGSRLEQPDFGIEDPTFDQVPVDLSSWPLAIGTWEPRADASAQQTLEDGVVRILEEVSS